MLRVASTAAQGHQAKPSAIGFEEVLPLGVDRVMLDNFDLGELASAVKIAKGRVELEASGGVDLERVRDSGGTGVDWVTVGGLTHTAPALDLSLLFES